MNNEQLECMYSYLPFSIKRQADCKVVLDYILFLQELVFPFIRKAQNINIDYKEDSKEMKAINKKINEEKDTEKLYEDKKQLEKKEKEIIATKLYKEELKLTNEQQGVIDEIQRYLNTQWDISKFLQIQTEAKRLNYIRILSELSIK